jgi:hypothetical protein
MIPKKIYWMLGYNNLSIILEQERRHWLMKTDKNKQIQDSLTGDLFQGTLDNLGSDIIIEAKKLPYKYNYKSDVKFGLENADKILDINASVFPHSATVNGFMFARILSTNFLLNLNDTLTKNHYKIKFTNATECIIPFGASKTSNEVYAGKWIKTSTPPTLMLLDEVTHDYTIQRTLSFNSDVTNVTWYYPLTETLQPFDVEFDGVSTYTLEAINSNDYIGYPLFWFTCDQTNIGSNITFTNNTNLRNEQMFFISNEGNQTPFNAKIYTCIDGSIDENGNCDATPDGTPSCNFIIRCNSKYSGMFNGSDSDFSRDLSNSIKIISTADQSEYTVEMNCPNDHKITMSKDISWRYIDSSTYEIDMSYFDQNCLDYFHNPLLSIFNVHFDESVPFVNSSTDVGMAGIRMSSSNPNSDTNQRYPLNINKWEGLPDWLNNLKDGMIPEHLAVYAFHQPPTYNPDDPETMQGAGLLFDPGRHKTDDEEIPNTIGRVYVLSNDGIEYINNSTNEYPKPARTAARICDIPTSVAQLANLEGLHDFPIVDNRYVRTEANFSEADKNRLYNILASRWVRPTALNKNGIPVNEANLFSNKFAFEVNYTPIGDHNFLYDVDMINHNDFRILHNLNPKVDVSKVHIGSITNKGTGYEYNDTGVCVVGGYSFSYVVTRISTNGRVEEVVLSPDSRASFINLSNFNMVDNPVGVTEEYGTSRVSGNGTGLKFRLVIEYDYYQTLMPYKGEFLDGLFALVNERDGLYVYDYIIDQSSHASPKRGTWTKGMRISEYDKSYTKKYEGGLSIKDTIMNLTIPSIRHLPIILKRDNMEPVSLELLQTGTFINIIDKTYSPVLPARPSSESHEIDDNVVDMCKYYCDGLITLNASSRDVNSVIKAIKESNIYRYNSYVIWRWSDNTSTSFVAGVVYRSFNNLFSTDTTTLLPKNELVCNNYVDTNPNTTIVWNVECVGMLVWMYDPKYNKKEDYSIDPATMNLDIARKTMSYNDIDFNGKNIKIIDDNNKYTFNVLTNNPACLDSNNTNVIYQQPELTQLDDVMVGLDANNTIDSHKLCGNWRLVFPRVESYVLSNDKTNTQWIPKRMQLVKGSIGDEIGTITDSEGNDVSTKTIVVNESPDGISLNMFNQTTGQWEKI